MAARFQTEFRSSKNVLYKIEIFDSSFMGAAMLFKVSDRGFSLKRQGENQERHARIIATECDFDFFIENETHEAFIDDLSQANEGRFSVKITKSGSAFWVGRILSDSTSYEDQFYPYGIVVSATDGLGVLKNVPYRQSANVAYIGTNSILGHIAEALKKLSHLPEFYTDGVPMFRTAVDWWEQNMVNSSVNDPLKLTWVDHAAFYKYKRTGERDFLSCYEVIDECLKPFGARLVHQEGVFWIQQISTMTAANYTVRRYDTDLDLLGTETVSSANMILQTTQGAKLNGVVYDFYPPIGFVSINQNVRNRRNYLAAETFNQAGGVVNFPAIDGNLGKTVIRLTGSFNVSLKNVSYTGTTGPQASFILVFNVRFRVGNKQVLRSYAIQNFSFVPFAAEWVPAPSTAAIAVGASFWPVPPIGQTKTGSIPLFFETPTLQANGDVDENEIEIELESIRNFDGSFVFPGDFEITWDLVNPIMEVYSFGGPAENEDARYYTASAVGSEVNTATIKIECDLGDSPNPNTIGRLQIVTGGSLLVNASLWGRGTQPPNNEILKILAKTVFDGQSVPIRKMKGTVYGQMDFFRKFDDLTRDWVLLGGTWTANTDEINGEWFELNYGESGVPTSPIKIKTKFPTITDVDTFPTGGNNTPNDYGLVVAQSPIGTVLAPVANTSLSAPQGSGTITTLSVSDNLGGGEFVTNDQITIFNPIIGVFETVIVTATNASGNTVNVSGSLQYEYPQGAYIIKKPIIGQTTLPGGSSGDFLTHNGAAWTAKPFVWGLDQLPEYISDEAAITGGLSVGDWYITAEGHYSSPSGIPKKIRTI